MTLLSTKDTVSRRVVPENAIRGSLVGTGDLIEVSYGPILLLRVGDSQARWTIRTRSEARHLGREAKLLDIGWPDVRPATPDPD
jgi:hypothetical protein